MLAAMLPSLQPVTLECTLPQQLLLGVAHTADDGTTLTVGLSWQDWSKFGEARLKMPGQSAPMFASDPFGPRLQTGASH